MDTVFSNTAPETIILDLGNSLLKGMKLAKPRTAKVIPHAIMKVGNQKLKDMQALIENGYGKGQLTETDLFSHGGQSVIVGYGAEGAGEDSRRSGGAKYTKDYYTFLMLGMLLKIAPKGHDNIRLIATFPPADTRHLKTIQESLGGKHVVTLVDGSKVTYKVREVMTIEEPVGGINNYLLSNDPDDEARRDLTGKKGLCIDLGGKISSLVPFQANGKIDHARAISIDLGIQDVMSDVSDALLAKKGKDYEAVFSAHRGKLPYDSIMRNCIRTGKYEAGGHVLEAQDIVQDAIKRICSDLRSKVDNEMGGIRPYNFAIITGGGGGALFEAIREHVLKMPPDKIFMSLKNVEQMHLANLFGASLTAEVYLREQ